MKLRIPLTLLAIGLVAVSCGDDGVSEVPTTGSIGVITMTVGADIDADGYTVAVDGVDGSDVGANSSVTLPSLAAGTYSIALLGIALNCQPATNPQSANVVAGQTASAQFDVTCVTANQTPVADAGPTQTLGDADDSGDELVTLDGSGSTDADGTIASWSWHVNRVEIGTGETLTVAAPVGVHTVSLTVTDDGGSVDTDEVSITVEAAPGDSQPPVDNQPPVANAGPNQTKEDFGNGAEDVTLDGSGSSDSDGTIRSWIWSEDGVVLWPSGRIVTVAFLVGEHTVTLTVTDDEGATDSEEVTITVTASPPDVGDVGLVCRRDQCRFDQGLANQCQVFLNECLAGSGDQDDDECVVAALLICEERGRD